MEENTQIEQPRYEQEPEVVVAKKGLKKPVLIGLIAGAAVLLAVIAVVVYLNLPSTTYGKAVKCLEAGDYNTAIDYFSEVLDYEDAEAKRKEAYVGAGRNLVLEKKYAEAVEVLEQTESQEMCSEVYFLAGKQMVADAQFADALNMLQKSVEAEAETYINYAQAMLHIGASEFDSAITILTNLGEFQDCQDLLNQTYYQKAEALYNQKNYSSAKTSYQKTTGYSDVAGKIANCDLMIADEYYKDGDLKKAQEAFKKIPAGTTVDGVSVDERLATLEANADKVALCGTWRGTGGKMKVRQTHKSTGLWDEWTAEFTDSITIKVVINGDGTFTFKGTAKYYIYTNYSSLSKYLKSMEMSETFSVTGKSLPKTLESNSLCTLTYSSGKIKLSFKLVDKNSSMNFKYTYSSSITYNVK